MCFQNWSTLNFHKTQSSISFFFFFISCISSFPTCCRRRCLDCDTLTEYVWMCVEHSCKDFRCTTKEFCISPDLVCDNVNHCEDGSDEAIGTLCEGKFNLLFFVAFFHSCVVIFTLCLYFRRNFNFSWVSSCSI